MNAYAETKRAIKLELAPPFADHMVLQRDRILPIWGKAEPSSIVTVQLGNVVKETYANLNGLWRIDMPPLPINPNPIEMIVTSDYEKICIRDILVGEVWIASGQSNMAFPLFVVQNASEELATANFPNIRLMRVPLNTANIPQDSIEGAVWNACNSETVRNFSSVAYFFARILHKSLSVPIGVISCVWVGSPMEVWTSLNALESTNTFKSAIDAVKNSIFEPQEAAVFQPASLFNGMVAPFIPFAIRGVIWYQGESNIDRHSQYRELSRLMITDWRQRWNQGDFPFIFAQLSGWKHGEDRLPLLREAQFQTLELPNTGMVVTTDLSNPIDVHPANKQEIGRRFALVAKGLVYGEQLEYSGPKYKQMRINTSAICLSFDHIANGLRIQGDSLRGFEIKYDGGGFIPAKARIEENEVIIEDAAVGESVEVRYNFTAYPDGNLTNSEGLPAAPFRTVINKR